MGGGAPLHVQSLDKCEEMAGPVLLMKMMDIIFMNKMYLLATWSEV